MDKRFYIINRRRKRVRFAVVCVCALLLLLFAPSISPQQPFTYHIITFAEESEEDTGHFDNPFDNDLEDFSKDDSMTDSSNAGSNEETAFYSVLLILAVLAFAAILVYAIASYIKRKKKEKERMKQEEKQKTLLTIKRFIAKDRVFYANLSDILSSNHYRICFAEEDGVLLQDTSGFYENGTYYFAAADETAAKKILLSCPTEYEKMRSGMTACNGETIAAIVADFFEYDVITHCYQVVYSPEKPIALKGMLQIEKATEKHLQTIIVTYDKESPEALKKLVERGNIYCAYAADEKQKDKKNFVGYIGQHPDGSMGLLLIFPEYRRHGYAEELESFQINKILAEGRTPYAHIITDNFKSIALQEKLGAIVAKDKVLWMRRSDGYTR